MKPRVLVLTGEGINCDYETAVAFEQAGASAERVHIGDLCAAPQRLGEYQILAVPGGFSYGDDLGSGKALAARLDRHTGGALREFVATGKLVIGICNGFQVLVNLGMLPGSTDDKGWVREVALTFNHSARFEDRWVPLTVNPESPCVFTKGLAELYLPVRHGEGRFVAAGQAGLDRLQQNGQVVLRYGSGTGAKYPDNPNGSVDGVAGICDTTGRVFGLMPHPEAAIQETNHPRWSRGEGDTSGPRQIFANAVAYCREVLTAKRGNESLFLDQPIMNEAPPKLIADLVLDAPAIILVGGLPGSGKTTFCEQYLSGIKIVSSDAIRKEIHADFNDKDDNDRVFQLVIEKVTEAAAAQQSVALDSQALLPEHREKYLVVANRYGLASYFILLNTPFEECMLRQFARGHTESIEKFQAGFSQTLDTLRRGELHAEGFTNTYSFNPDELAQLKDVRLVPTGEHE